MRDKYLVRPTKQKLDNLRVRIKKLQMADHSREEKAPGGLGARTKQHKAPWAGAACRARGVASRRLWAVLFARVSGHAHTAARNFSRPTRRSAIKIAASYFELLGRPATARYA